MDYIPKRNLLSEHTERDLAFLMADRDPAKYQENLYKLRAVTNSPQKEPLTRKQMDTLARGMAGGKTASREGIADKKAEIHTILGKQNNAPKKDLLKEQSLKKEAPGKAAEDKHKSAYQPTGPAMPDVIKLPSGKTFVRTPEAVKQVQAAKEAKVKEAQAKHASKMDAPKPTKPELPQVIKLGDRTFVRPATPAKQAGSSTKQTDKPSTPKRNLLEGRENQSKLPTPTQHKTPTRQKERGRSR
ncbi:hypothetical protein [Cerasicoccus fimbriatus]|uniref:hypothetical protein n=1 Tax=Cerasicoccus fimbriatus TaxID=3014554 RepID=UPI0022B53AC1|nr:hypothetical protein [Cerasicoccus sp. TK19100]